MTPAEANVLLTKAALLDPRMKRVNLVEQADMATAWSEVLEDVSLEGALRVLPLHYRRTDAPLTPAAVVDLLDDLTAHTPPNLTQQRIARTQQRVLAVMTREEYIAAVAELSQDEIEALLSERERAIEMRQA